jgi:hypothetical protein
MSMLTVVYMQSTNSVLAAVTRAAPPEPGEPVTALVGTSLPVSAIGQTSIQMAIPASALAAVTVNDTQPDALLHPHSFQVVDDPQDKTIHHVIPLTRPPAIPPPPKITLTLSKAAGAVIHVAHVAQTTLTIDGVLQNVLPKLQAATLTGPVKIGPSNTAVKYPVAPGSQFQAGETWSLAVFIQGMPPHATSKKF